MPTAVESVLNFLRAQIKAGHKGPDLVERYLLYGCDMETQVNVYAGRGEPVAGKRSTYTDGIDEWFSFRVPKNAYDTPEFKDFPLRFALHEKVEGIGSTGWDWKARRSRWVGFDFDSIVGHAAGVGVTADDLDRVRQAAQALPYVEARRSTGGSGLHLYVPFADDPAFNTANHHEHAAVARCVLGIMSRDARFDFNTTVDACGGNMWIWHCKSANSKGLALIKAAECPFAAEQLPTNWRDHLEVISRKRVKVRLGGMEEQHQDPFEQLATAHRHVPLDAMHNKIMDELVALGVSTIYIADHHLLQTHTVGLARLMERKDELGLQGIFETNSPGKDLATPNCFAFPLDNGGWKVYRFGPGTNEAATWEQDGRGWTTCWFNVRPNLDVACRSMGGRKLNRGGYEFDSLEKAVEVARVLKPGTEIPVEEHLKNRKAVVSKSKEGQLAIEVRKKAGDEDLNMGDWNDSDRKTAWTQLFNVAAQPEKLEVTDYDELIRCLETSEGQPCGWAAKKDSGEWTRKNAGSIKTILQDLGHAKAEAEQIMGRNERRPWKLVTLPFQPEYPGNRTWNLNAPQYRYLPAPRLDEDATYHPHWDRILDHVGQDLTQYLRDLEWALQCGIRTGADYLRAIFASILREPAEPTPYLFLFGPENCGKTIIHEAFELLVTSGVVKADRALTSQNDFNGELAGAILCVIEEKDIGKTPGAHAKIKDFVTTRRLSVRKMRTDPFMVDNMTHWIQCANKHENCPVFDGDTRITMIYVPPLPANGEIPRTMLHERLKEEAPQFMRTLMDLQLPPQTGRLRIPIVNTQHKERAAELNRNALETFIREHVHDAPGYLLPFSEFYDRFYESLPLEEKHEWHRNKVSKMLPMKFRSGSGTGNKVFVINASWEKPDKPGTPYAIVNGRIKKS